jgi:hypothetical protein
MTAVTLLDCAALSVTDYTTCGAGPRDTPDNGKSFEHKLWFSDVHVRTPAGWRYVFGQASLPVSASPCITLMKNVHASAVRFLKPIQCAAPAPAIRPLAKHAVSR